MAKMSYKIKKWINNGKKQRWDMVDKYEDPFVKISHMIGGDEYLKVSRSLLK